MIKLESLENLKKLVGKKISILEPNELVPTCYKGTLNSFYVGNYAQYENALFINIRLFRKRKDSRIVILPTTTAFIFKGDYDKTFNKERVSDNVSLLHRVSFNGIKDNENLILAHKFNEDFENNTQYENFLDVTADYTIDRNLRGEEQIESKDYINYIKDLVSTYNVNKLNKYIDINIAENCILHECIRKAIEINY